METKAILNENKWAHNGTIWPFVNAYEAGAWMKAGHVAGGLDLLKRFSRACADAGTDTIWEMIYPDGRIPASPDNRYLLSMCHAWGATGNYYLMRYVLGVEPLEPGFGRIRITPELGDLEWVRAVVPTPHGPVKVQVSRDGVGRVRTQVQETPSGIRIEGQELPRRATSPRTSSASWRHLIAPGSFALTLLKSASASTAKRSGFHA